MFTNEMLDKAVEVLDGCRMRGVRLTTAESCTGGLISALLTEIPGASEAFDRGFVTYSDASKTQMLGVPAELIEEYGAVSEQTATAMAQAALKRADADMAVAVTGIAGPSGETDGKPIGLVYVAVVTNKNLMVAKNHFAGSRAEIRLQAVAKAMDMLRDTVNYSFASAAAA